MFEKLNSLILLCKTKTRAVPTPSKTKCKALACKGEALAWLCFFCFYYVKTKEAQYSHSLLDKN